MAGSHKIKFVALDGLRGLAALAVVFFHAQQFLGAKPLLPSAYLAVDFFFMLSGFIIAFAYEHKLNGSWTFRRFAVTRIFRLYPLYILGCAIVLAVQLAEGMGALPGLWRIKWAGLSALAAVIFAPFHSPIVGWTLFPLNPPAWSLFVELLINAAYGAVLFRLQNRTLAVLAVGFLVPLGWSLTAAEGGDAYLYFLRNLAPRVLYSFTAGVLIFRAYRAGWLARMPAIPFPMICIALLASFTIPVETIYGRAAAFIGVALGYPILMVAGIYSAVGKRSVPLARFGELYSYSLSALHYPVLVCAAFAATITGASATALITAGSFIALLIAMAAQRYWDAPLSRKLSTWLHRRRLPAELTADIAAPTLLR